MGRHGEVDVETVRGSMASDTEDVDQRVEWLFDHAADALSTWEVDFLQSIDGRETLSVRQREKLDEIYAKRGGR